MQYKKIKITELVPASYNPRKKLKPGDPEFEKIKHSITEFGFVDPIIVNSDMTIIGGHQRWYVLKHLGHKEADCVVVDIDKTKEKALNIALNKITGAWDNEKLAALLRDLQELDYNMEFTGFDPPEIDEVFNSVHTKETHEDDCSIPLPETPVTRPGDVWQLGRHRLICGDSTDPQVIKELMDGKKANLVVTEPPCEAKELHVTLLQAFRNMANVMANDASTYIFHFDTVGLLYRRAFDDAGFYLSGVCIWMKQATQENGSPYQCRHKSVLYGWKKNGKHNWYSDRKQATLWMFERETKSEAHPEMLPITLCAYPLLNSSMTNSIILDPFGGTGPVLIAAEQIGRICYMAELDPRYCDIVVQRYMAQAKNGSDVFLIRNGKKQPRKKWFEGGGK